MKKKPEYCISSFFCKRLVSAFVCPIKFALIKAPIRLALTFVGRLLYLSGTTRSALPFSFIIWHFFQNILFLFSPTRKKSLNRREKLSRKCIKEIFREWNFCCVSFFCLNVWKLVGRFLFYFKKNFLMFLRKKKKILLCLQDWRPYVLRGPFILHQHCWPMKKKCWNLTWLSFQFFLVRFKATSFVCRVTQFTLKAEAKKVSIFYLFKTFFFFCF